MVRGYQHEIRNSNKLPSVAGFIYEEGGKRGRMCLVGQQAVWGADGKQQIVGSLITEKEFASLFKVDAWNDVVIIAKGHNIQHYPQRSPDSRLHRQPSQGARLDGVLALQLHAGVHVWAEFKKASASRTALIAACSARPAPVRDSLPGERPARLTDAVPKR